MLDVSTDVTAPLFVVVSCSVSFVVDTAVVVGAAVVGASVVGATIVVGATVVGAAVVGGTGAAGVGVRIGGAGISSGGAGLDAALLLELEHLAGGSIDIALIFGAAGAELHLIEHHAVIEVKLHLAPCHIAYGHTGPGSGSGQGSVLTDISLIAGRAGLRDRVAGKIAGAGDQGDLIDGERRKAFHSEGGILGHYLLDQGRLAYRNTVGLGQLGQLVSLRHRLAENGGADAAAAKAGADGVGDLRLELGRALLIRILHTDQDGILQVAEVTVLEHGADDGIYRHIQVGTRQIHVTQDHLGLLIEGVGPDDFLSGIDGQGDTGVHIQHDHGIHRVAALPEIVAEYADTQGQRCRHGHQRCPAVLVFLGIGSIVIHDLAHRYHISFLLIVGGKDTVEHIRRRMVHGLCDPLFQLLVSHIT